MLEPCQQFHERLASELSDLRSRLSAGHSQCIAALERDNTRLKVENAQLLAENARLRESALGGDPDSAAGCPRPRIDAPNCSLLNLQQTPPPAPIGSVLSPLEGPPPLVLVGGAAREVPEVSSQRNDSIVEIDEHSEIDSVVSSLRGSWKTVEPVAKKSASAHEGSSETVDQAEGTIVRHVSGETPSNDGDGWCSEQPTRIDGDVDDDDDNGVDDSRRSTGRKTSVSVVVQLCESGLYSPKPLRSSRRESLASVQSCCSPMLMGSRGGSMMDGSRRGSLSRRGSFLTAMKGQVSSGGSGTLSGLPSPPTSRHASFDASVSGLPGVPNRRCRRASTLPDLQEKRNSFRLLEDIRSGMLTTLGSTDSLEELENSKNSAGDWSPSKGLQTMHSFLVGDSPIDEFVLLDVWTMLAGTNFLRKKSMKSMALDQIVQQELMQEEAEYGENKSFRMIHPSSTKHIIFEFCGFLLIAYDCFTVPLEVFDPPELTFFIFMRWISRIFWTLHIYVSFSTGFMLPEGKVELDPKIVAKSYVSSWFLFDACLVLVDWWEVLAWKDRYFIVSGRVMRFFRMFRTVKLIRMIQTPDFARLVTDKIRSEELILCGAIARTMILMLAVAHFLACAWYFIGQAQSNSWLQVYRVDQQAFGSRYLWSIHWALSQFSGEALFFSSLSVIERNFTVCALFGCFMLSTYIVSSLTSSIARSQSVSSQTAALSRYLYDHKISRSLALRIENNAKYVMAEQKRTAPESSIELLKLISEPLLVELHFEVNFDVLACHPFFRCYNEVNPSGIRTLCHTAMSVLVVCREDILFSEGEAPTNPRMFFPASGQLEYKQEDQEPQSVTARNWLCEPVLWTRWTHHGTLRASSDCRFHVLDAGKFQKIMSRCNAREPMHYAEHFVMKLNQRHAKNVVISDIGDPFDRSLRRALEYAFPLGVVEEEDEEDSEEEDMDGVTSIKSSLVSRKKSAKSTRGQRFSWDGSQTIGWNTATSIPQKLCSVLCMRWQFLVGRSRRRGSWQGGKGSPVGRDLRGNSWQGRSVRFSGKASPDEATLRESEALRNVPQSNTKNYVVPLS